MSDGVATSATRIAHTAGHVARVKPAERHEKGTLKYDAPHLDNCLITRLSRWSWS